MRPEKESIIGEVRQYVAESDFVLIVNHDGLTVEMASELRTQLSEADAEIHVVKNTLFNLVAREMGWTNLDESLKGPTAIIVGKDDVRAAKIVKKFAAENKTPAIKAGMCGDDFLTAADVIDLANLPSREVLLGQVVGTIAAPMTRLVGVMNQKVSSLLYVLKAIEQKKA